jgi:tetratricopeptide (TPR) repeat protein
MDIAGMLLTAWAKHQAGDLDEAEAIYRQVLRADCDEPRALHLLGAIAYQRGQYDQAIALMRRSIATAPEAAEVHADLGDALRAMGRAEEAVVSCRAATTLKPDCAPFQAGLARALNDEQDYAAALQAGQRAVAADPQLARAHASVAMALVGLGRLPEAAKAYQQSLRLNPSQPETLSQFAIVLSALQHFDAALICHRQALALEPSNAHLHLAMARSLVHHLDMAGGAVAARQALALWPDSVDALVILGICLSSLGQFAEAGDVLRRAQSLDPNNAEAYRALVAIRQSVSERNEIERLEVLLQQPEAPREDRIAASFSLGHCLDRMGQYDEAFPYIVNANRLLREMREEAGHRFDLADLRHQADQAIAHGTADFFTCAREWGNPSELPVFIVGMPRSGTTLVERIVARHPQVASMGELMDLSRIARRMMLENPGRPVEAWDAANARRHANAYLAKLKTAASPGIVRVVDKMPDNVRVLGLVAAMFPRARVVLCQRDLRDVCLSCYFQHFARGHDYSTDLADCAWRGLEIERLTAHWSEVLPGQKLMVCYETLVRDFEAQARRLVEFLGLPWDPACLDFHEADTSIATASFWQVRQPISDRSIGRWRLYERHLAPLLAVLGQSVATTV